MVTGCGEGVCGGEVVLASVLWPFSCYVIFYSCSIYLRLRDDVHVGVAWPWSAMSGCAVQCSPHYMCNGRDMSTFDIGGIVVYAVLFCGGKVAWYLDPFVGAFYRMLPLTCARFVAALLSDPLFAGVVIVPF